MGQRTLSPLRRLARAWYNGSLEREPYLNYRRQLLDALEQGLPLPTINPPERRPSPTATEQTTQRVPVPAPGAPTVLLLGGGLAVALLAVAGWWFQQSRAPQPETPATGTSAAAGATTEVTATPPAPAAGATAPRVDPPPPAPILAPPAPPPPVPQPIAQPHAPRTVPEHAAVSATATAEMEARLRDFMRAGQWLDSQANSALIIHWLDLSPPQIEALRGTVTFRAFADALNAKVREARQAKKHEIEAQLERLADRLGIRLPQAGATGGAQLRAAAGCAKDSLASGRPFCRDRLPHGGPAPLMQILVAGRPAAHTAVSTAPLSASDWQAYCGYSGQGCDPPRPSTALSQSDNSAYARWLAAVTGHPYHAVPAEAVPQPSGVNHAAAGSYYLALNWE